MFATSKKRNNPATTGTSCSRRAFRNRLDGLTVKPGILQPLVLVRSPLNFRNSTGVSACMAVLKRFWKILRRRDQTRIRHQRFRGFSLCLLRFLCRWGILEDFSFGGQRGAVRSHGSSRLARQPVAFSQRRLAVRLRGLHHPAHMSRSSIGPHRLSSSTWMSSARQCGRLSPSARPRSMGVLFDTPLAGQYCDICGALILEQTIMLPVFFAPLGQYGAPGVIQS